MNRSSLVFFATLLIAACGPKQLEPDAASECSNCERWNRPQEPFRLYGNTWYVGTAGLSSILIETGDGLILIDGALAQSATVIEANLEAAGFELADISTILVSHAHFDHAGGVAALQRITGARVYSSPEGAKGLRSGMLQSNDPQYDPSEQQTAFEAIRNVVAVADSDSVSVGDVDVTAVHTPGHTPGGVTWTWESCALGVCYDIVYADSLTAVSAKGYRFSDTPAVDQIRESARKISELNCDVLLSPHPFFFGMQDKLERRENGNPFVNNVACMMYAESALDWLRQRLQSEGS